MKFEDQISIGKKLSLLRNDKQLPKSTNLIIVKCIIHCMSGSFLKKTETIEKTINLLNEALEEPSNPPHIRTQLNEILHELLAQLKDILRKKGEFTPLRDKLLIIGTDLYKIQLGKVFDTLVCKIYKEGVSIASTVFNDLSMYRSGPEHKLVSWILESVPTLTPHLNKVSFLVHHLLRG